MMIASIDVFLREKVGLIADFILSNKRCPDA